MDDCVLDEHQPSFSLVHVPSASLPDEIQGVVKKNFQFMQQCTKLAKEAKEKQKIIDNLPPCHAYDDEGVFIPRNKREGMFFMAEQMKEYYEKRDQLQQVFEVNRRETFVSKHKIQHPPNTEECFVCHESIPITSNKCVQYLVCCGNICCYKCIQASVTSSGEKVIMTKCPLCRSNLFIETEETVRLIKLCADKGKAWAQAQMGIYYLEGSSCEHGDAVPYQVDKKEALKWLNLAADQRDPDAIRIIAQLYYGMYGAVDGIVQCVVKARSIMKEAADLGNLRAQQY